MSGATTFSRGENPLRADKLNQAYSERVLRTGDTMTGSFLLVGDPVQWNEAATKQYVDRIATGAVGIYLPLTGGTVTGPLTISAAFTVNAGTNQVNFNFAGGSGVVHISHTTWFSGITFDVNNTAYGQFLRTNRNNKARWIMEIGSDDPETGGNSGTNFSLQNFDDSGNLLGTPISINRATGTVLINGIAGGPAGPAGPTGATGPAGPQGIPGTSGSLVISPQTVNTVVGNAITVPAGTNYIIVNDSVNAVNSLTVGSGSLSDGYNLWMTFPNGGMFSGQTMAPHGNLTLMVLGGGWSILSKFG